MKTLEDPLTVKSGHCEELKAESLEMIETEIKQEIPESVDPLSTEFIKEETQETISVDEITIEDFKIEHNV